MNIPPSAHPSVKEFLTSKALEFLEVKYGNTQELMKHLPSVSRDVIKSRIDVASSAAETSFALVLTPPVSCCIKVRIILKTIFLVLICFSLVSPTVRSNDQEIYQGDCF